MQIFRFIIKLISLFIKVLSPKNKKKTEKAVTATTPKASDRIPETLKQSETETVSADPSVLAAVAALKRNGIIIETDVGEAELPDESKIGGLPYLPADFVWPTFTDEEGVTRPLSFLCQIKLDEVTELDSEHLLPETGILAFFYDCASFRWGFDPADRGCARVYYFENMDGFIPHAIPEDISDEYKIPAMPLVCTETVDCYPVFDEASVLGEFDCDWDAYDAAREELGVTEEEERHLMLGYADVIQNEMLTECEYVTRGIYRGDATASEALTDEERAEIAEAAKDWVLLLQMSTVEKDGYELMWGDCGMLYFYIKKEDLAARRFENAWFALQCF